MKRILNFFILATLFVFTISTSALAIDITFHDGEPAWDDLTAAGVLIEQVTNLDFLQPGLTYNLSVIDGLAGKAENSLDYEGVTFYTHTVSSLPTTYENVELQKLTMHMVSNTPTTFDFANEEIYYTGSVDVDLHSVMDTDTIANRIIVFNLLENTNINGVDYAQGSLIFFFEMYQSAWDTDYNDLVMIMTPSVVPVPAAALLLGSGLFGLGILRKKM